MKLKKLGALIIGALLSIGVAAGIGATVEKDVAYAADTSIVFNLGANGSASHNDGSEKTTYSETVDGYTLNITGGSKMYTSARDAKGNSCIKFGTSSAAGKCSFTVPADITSVILAVGKYKTNTSKVTINGTTTTLTKSSNDGAYDEITVDTSSTKTISFTTVSGGYRAMLNTITWVKEQGGSEGPVYPTTVTVTPKTASVPQGSTQQLTATINDGATNDISWKSSNENLATVDQGGLVTVLKNATVNETVIITAYSENDESVSDSATITVAEAIPSSNTLYRSGYAKYKVGQKITDYENGRLYLKYTNGEKDIEITDPKLSATVDGVSFDILNETFTKEHDDKELKFTYKDGDFVATFTSNITLQIFEELEITSIKTNFNTNSNFILSNITNTENSITITYDCWDNKSAEVTVESSDKNQSILNIGEADKSMNSSTGTIILPLAPVVEAEGQVELVITLTHEEFTDSDFIVIPVVKGVEIQTEGGEKTTTIDTTQQGYANQETVTKITSGDLTIEFSQGTNSNPPKYYTSGTAIRIYGGNTVKVSSVSTITKIVITFGSSDGSNAITANEGSYDAGTWTGSSTSVTFTVGGTSGNRRFQVFDITTNGGETTIVKESDDFLAANQFVNTYMHHSDISIKDEGNGACGEYFTAAIEAFTDLTNAQRLILKDVFTLSYARLQAWARANNTTFEISEEGKIVESTTGLKNIILRSDESSLIIILVSIVALTGFAFFYVSKRNKKEIEF